MKIAIIGSRRLKIHDLEKYLPENTEEIVSGGAIGIDKCAENYAKKHDIKFTVFLPNYEKYGKSAPLRRNDEIIAYSDIVIAFWDKESKGTKYVINRCQKNNKQIIVYEL